MDGTDTHLRNLWFKLKRVDSPAANTDLSGMENSRIKSEETAVKRCWDSLTSKEQEESAWRVTCESRKVQQHLQLGLKVRV